MNICMDCVWMPSDFIVDFLMRFFSGFNMAFVILNDTAFSCIIVVILMRKKEIEKGN